MKLDIAAWDVPDMNVLTFPENESHFTFFKSACKEHLFSMTKTGKIFEVVFVKTKKVYKFELVRVL